MVPGGIPPWFRKSGQIRKEEWVPCQIFSFVPQSRLTNGSNPQRGEGSMKINGPFESLPHCLGGSFWGSWVKQFPLAFPSSWKPLVLQRLGSFRCFSQYQTISDQNCRVFLLMGNETWFPGLGDQPGFPKWKSLTRDDS